MISSSWPAEIVRPSTRAKGIVPPCMPAVESRRLSASSSESAHRVPGPPSSSVPTTRSRTISSCSSGAFLRFGLGAGAALLRARAVELAPAHEVRRGAPTRRHLCTLLRSAQARVACMSSAAAATLEGAVRTSSAMRAPCGTHPATTAFGGGGGRPCSSATRLYRAMAALTTDGSGQPRGDSSTGAARVQRRGPHALNCALREDERVPPPAPATPSLRSSRRP